MSDSAPLRRVVVPAVPSVIPPTMHTITLQDEDDGGLLDASEVPYESFLTRDDREQINAMMRTAVGDTVSFGPWRTDSEAKARTAVTELKASRFRARYEHREPHGVELKQPYFVFWWTPMRCKCVIL